MTGGDRTSESLVRLGREETGEAIALLESAGDDPLAVALLEHLRSVERGDVYSDPAAFQAFIDHGANPRLYAETSAALRSSHEGYRSRRVVDVGCGDGRVTAAALPPCVEQLVLVEPSTELLRQAVARLSGTTVGVDSVNSDVQQWLASSPARADAVQSTFALHNLAPAERTEVLRGLRGVTDRLVVVEFDVPSFADHSIEHAEYVTERYRRGIAEYPDHPLVVSGFLMPVLVGQFDPTRHRSTFEQPIARWVDDLAATGWSRITTSPLTDYWWATAVMVTAVA